MKVRVLIVSKTHMRHSTCVGGLVANTYQNIRLLQHDGSNQPLDAAYHIGEIWELEFSHREHLQPPHVEDVLVQNQTYQCQISNLRQFLLERVQPWEGYPDNLYDGLLQYTTKQKGYICQRTGVPDQSVGFWIIPTDLHHQNSRSKDRYILDNHGLDMPYVGGDPMVATLPAGTLIRVSLARWWRPDNSHDEERCYLQLSGWYE